MKILIYGAKGFMGQRFHALYPDAYISSVDIADTNAVSAELDREKPEIVINAAGKTGVPNVDWCEDHKLETLRSNVAGPLVLLDACAKRNIYWVHLSSGCIYEGDNGSRGFAEEDPPNFSGSFYSRTKGWSDQMLRDCSKEAKVLILRLRMPFDASSDPRNLLIKLRKYSKVLETKNSITFIDDFLSSAKTLIEKRRTGVYNIVNPGLMSPFEIMTRYKEIVDPSHHFERLDLASLGTVVKAGRSNCLLSIAKLEAEGIKLRSIEEAIDEALKGMKK